MVSEIASHADKHPVCLVLILVLVEDGLGVNRLINFSSHVLRVLILVLVEDGLGAFTTQYGSRRINTS